MCKVWSDNDNAQGVDTCKGDGGSPLTCKIQGRNSWVQVSHPSPSPDSHQSLSATNMARSKESTLEFKFDQCIVIQSKCFAERDRVLGDRMRGGRGARRVRQRCPRRLLDRRWGYIWYISSINNSIPPGEEILWGGEILSVWISPRGRLLGRWANVRLQVAAESTS